VLAIEVEPCELSEVGKKMVAKYNHTPAVTFVSRFGLAVRCMEQNPDIPPLEMLLLTWRWLNCKIIELVHLQQRWHPQSLL
jgi:hypothetical protein